MITIEEWAESERISLTRLIKENVISINLNCEDRLSEILYDNDEIKYIYKASEKRLKRELIEALIERLPDRFFYLTTERDSMRGEIRLRMTLNAGVIKDPDGLTKELNKAIKEFLEYEDVQ